MKAKGFSLFEKLLKDNNQSGLIEENIMKMFCGLHGEGIQKTTAKIYQKQITGNLEKMIPALKPAALSFKMLSFVGPRRQIDLENWLEFSFERLFVRDRKSIVPLGHQSANFLPDEGDYRVSLVPKVKGLLPAFPYGYDTNLFASQIPFYSLAKSTNC